MLNYVKRICLFNSRRREAQLLFIALQTQVLHNGINFFIKLLIGFQVSRRLVGQFCR